jgi:hypothetical protein
LLSSMPKLLISWTVQRPPTQRSANGPPLKAPTAMQPVVVHEMPFSRLQLDRGGAGGMSRIHPAPFQRSARRSPVFPNVS